VSRCSNRPFAAHAGSVHDVRAGVALLASVACVGVHRETKRDDIVCQSVIALLLGVCLLGLVLVAIYSALNGFGTGSAPSRCGCRAAGAGGREFGSTLRLVPRTALLLELLRIYGVVAA